MLSHPAHAEHAACSTRSLPTRRSSLFPLAHHAWDTQQAAHACAGLTDTSGNLPTFTGYNMYETVTAGACSGVGCCGGNTKYQMVQDTSTQYQCAYVQPSPIFNVQVSGCRSDSPIRAMGPSPHRPCRWGERAS